jgi:hypothetical protein
MICFSGVEVSRSRCGDETQKKLTSFFSSSFLLRLSFASKNRSYDSFFPKDGNPLEPDLTKNVGSLPLGLTVAEDIFAAGGGLAPKFVGTPVPLPPAPSSAGSQVASPPLSPIEGGLGGVVRAPRSAGTDYEPEPGLGEVSDLFVRPSSRN